MPWSNRGFDPSVIVDSMVLMLQGGGRSLEDLRELKQEEGLMGLIGRDEIPKPDTVGDWLRRMGDPSRGQRKDFEKGRDQGIHVGCGCDRDCRGESRRLVHL
jgi:hypothetical protein